MKDTIKLLLGAVPFILLALLLMGLFSCEQEEIKPTTLGYVGLWQEATGKQGAYDVDLSYSGSYIFSLVSGAKTVASVEGGYIRNDTLIFDNGVFEYQCCLYFDTLIYTTKVSTEVEKLVRIE